LLSNTGSLLKLALTISSKMLFYDHCSIMLEYSVLFPSYVESKKQSGENKVEFLTTVLIGICQ
jgi:hypothetical protein